MIYRVQIAVTALPLTAEIFFWLGLLFREFGPLIYAVPKSRNGIDATVSEIERVSVIEPVKAALRPLRKSTTLSLLT